MKKKVMEHIRKIFTTMKIFLIALSLIFLFAGCKAQKQLPLSQNETANVSASQYWRVTLNSFKTAAKLAGTIETVQYDGSVTHSNVNEKPQDGYVFVLLNLTVEKTQNGKAKFSWKDTTLQDASGNIYARHKNDTFLENVGYSPRLRATDQTLGKETGWVCFEVPSNTGTMYLVYNNGDEEMKFSIGKIK
jgi:outer membrane biogenesis lipoprotein LolB